MLLIFLNGVSFEKNTWHVKGFLLLPRLNAFWKISFSQRLKFPLPLLLLFFLVHILFFNFSLQCLKSYDRLIPSLTGIIRLCLYWDNLLVEHLSGFSLLPKLKLFLQLIDLLSLLLSCRNGMTLILQIIMSTIRFRAVFNWLLLW